MRYIKIINEINKRKNLNIEKDQLYKMYMKAYKNENIRSFSNMISYLKKNNILTEIEKNKYMVVTKDIYKYNEKEEEKRIYKTIKNEYPKINFIVWNTKSLNDFTLHYVMKNYIIVEVEKYAIDLLISLLNEKFSKKYIITTSKVLNDNRNLYANSNNIIIIKPLIVKSPLDYIEDKKVISIEKIMVDLYIDKLYLFYQGKELQNMYENIFAQYNINIKKLLAYANLRTNLEVYKSYLKSLDLVAKY